MLNPFVKASIYFKVYVFRVMPLLFLSIITAVCWGQSSDISNTNPIRNGQVNITSDFHYNEEPLLLEIQSTERYYYPFQEQDSTTLSLLHYHFHDDYNSTYRSTVSPIYLSKISFRNQTDINADILLQVYGNRRTHKLVAYTDTIAPTPMAITGKHLSDLRKRTIGSNDLLIPVKLNASGQLELYLYHHTSLTQGVLKCKIWESNNYITASAYKNLVLGIYIGTILLLILFVTLIGTLYRERVYWIYLVFMASYLFYVIQYTGYADIFIYPIVYTFSHDPRILFSLSALIALVYLLKELINFEKHTIKNGVRYIYLIIGLIIIAGATRTYYRYTNDDIATMASYFTTGCILMMAFIIIFGIFRSRKSHPLEASILTLSISVNFLTYFWTKLIEAHILPALDFPLSTIQLGFLAELIAITCYLGINIRSKTVSHQQAIKVYSEKQAAMAQSLYQTRVAERNRIREDLEKEILPSLQLLKNNSVNNTPAYNKLLQDTEHRLNTVHSGLSNENLSTLDLHVKCSELVEFYSSMQASYSIDLALSDNTKPGVIRELYLIIRELYENASKHSKAKYVHINLNDQQGVVELKYNDDGIGIQSKKTVQGIGMSSIKKRVLDLNGQINLLTQRSGLSIDISVPT